MTDKQKKFLFYALLVTIVYVLLVFFVVGDDPVGMNERALIVIFWAAIIFFVYMGVFID